jgi:polyribonucleotide nucleotidyltransferase
MDWVNRITYQPKPGDEIEGTVVSVVDFGAFVEIAPGRDGLVHISEMRPYRVNQVTDIVKVGDVVKVKVLGMEKGKISLTMKPYYQGEAPMPSNPRPNGHPEDHQF